MMRIFCFSVGVGLLVFVFALRIQKKAGHAQFVSRTPPAIQIADASLPFQARPPAKTKIRQISASSSDFSKLSYMELRKLFYDTLDIRSEMLVKREFGTDYFDRLYQKAMTEIPGEGNWKEQKAAVRAAIAARAANYLSAGRCFTTKVTLPTEEGGVDLSFALAFRYEGHADTGKIDLKHPASIQIDLITEKSGLGNELSGIQKMNQSGKEYLIYELANFHSDISHQVSFVALEFPSAALEPVEVLYAGPTDLTWKTVQTQEWVRQQTESEAWPDQPLKWNDSCVFEKN